MSSYGLDCSIIIITLKLGEFMQKYKHLNETTTSHSKPLRPSSTNTIQSKTPTHPPTTLLHQPHQLPQRLAIPPVPHPVQLALDGPVRAGAGHGLVQQQAEAPLDAGVEVAEGDDQTRDELELAGKRFGFHRGQRLLDLHEGGGVVGEADAGQAGDFGFA